MVIVAGKTAYRPVPDDRSWRNRAECQDADPELFYSDRAADLEEAKSWCGLCPVRRECLDDAMQMPVYDDWGVRGGLTSGQRRHMRATSGTAGSISA
jgi:WhiB family transcriptional regulator, redox-sensing transcriptional regulator